MPHKIITIPNTLLRKRAGLVAKSEFGSAALTDTIRTMSETLRSTEDGVGIAAPQIGILKRMFIASEEALAIDRENEEEAGTGPKDKAKKKKLWKHYVFINPEIVKSSAKIVRGSEGCLSVPKKYGIVPRSEKVRVRAYDEYGKPFERGATKLFARLLQHECDHLEGILFTDKAEKTVTISKRTT